MKSFVRNSGQRQPTYTETMGQKFRKVLEALGVVHKAHGPVAEATKAVKQAERALAGAKDDESKAKADAALAAAKVLRDTAIAPWTEAKLAAKAAVIAEKDLLEGKEQRVFLTYLQNGATDFRIRNGEIFTQKIHPGLLMSLANSMGEGEEDVKDGQARKADPFYALRWEAAARFHLTVAAISLAVELGTNFARGFLNGLEHLVMTALPAAITAAHAAKDHDRLTTLLDYEENLVTGKAAKDGQKGKRALVPFEMLQAWRKRATERQAASAAGKSGSSTLTAKAGGVDSAIKTGFITTAGGRKIAIAADPEGLKEAGIELDSDEAVEGAQDAQG